MSSSELDLYINEVKMMARIDHPNIVKLIRVHESKQHIFIIMELVKAGTLTDFIKYRQLKFSPLTDEDCSCIMKQIFEGIDYIHKMNIIHRDIKPQNILMRSLNKLDKAVKIADFGLGMQGKEASTENCGTMIYMAPEQFSKGVYNKVFKE